MTVTCWVDDKQTQVYATDGTLTPQTVVIARGAPLTEPEEIVVEVSILARGTSIQVQLEVPSNSVSGIFLPESIDIHFLPLREARADPMRTAITEVLASTGAAGISAGAGNIPTLVTGASVGTHGTSAGTGAVSFRGILASISFHGQLVANGYASKQDVYSDTMLAQRGVKGIVTSTEFPGVSAATGRAPTVAVGASTGAVGVSAGTGAVSFRGTLASQGYPGQSIVRGYASRW
jgi:hypothetical protein